MFSNVGRPIDLIRKARGISQAAPLTPVAPLPKSRRAQRRVRRQWLKGRARRFPEETR